MCVLVAFFAQAPWSPLASFSSGCNRDPSRRLPAALFAAKSPRNRLAAWSWARSGLRRFDAIAAKNPAFGCPACLYGIDVAGDITPSQDIDEAICSIGRAARLFLPADTRPVAALSAQ